MIYRGVMVVDEFTLIEMIGISHILNCMYQSLLGIFIWLEKFKEMFVIT